jgi:predicted nucleic acid-binding protein
MAKPEGVMAMTPPSCWPDPSVPAALDTSAVINLNGTGLARDILRALSREIIVVDEVELDLGKGVATGRRDAEHLQELVTAGLIRRVCLGETGKGHFEWLSIGAGEDTLDDGEAATIALAAEIGCAAMLDESKGRRLCKARHPSVPLLGSIEMFTHPDVGRHLGERLGDALYGALTTPRMHVLPEFHAWVIGVLGPERAALCKSLPRAVRS